MIDLDAMIDGMPPWDLSIRIDGGEYRVREVSDQEMLRVGKSMGDDAALREFLAGLFDGPAPDVARLSVTEAAAAIAAVVGYWQARVKRVTVGATVAGILAWAGAVARGEKGAIDK